MVIPAESTTFLAGNEIYGRMEVNCRGDGGSKGKSEILIGEIGIELIAYDGTSSGFKGISEQNINSRNKNGGMSSPGSYIFTFPPKVSVALR